VVNIKFNGLNGLAKDKPAKRVYLLKLLKGAVKLGLCNTTPNAAPIAGGSGKGSYRDY